MLGMQINCASDNETTNARWQLLLIQYKEYNESECSGSSTTLS